MTGASLLLVCRIAFFVSVQELDLVIHLGEKTGVNFLEIDVFFFQIGEVDAPDWLANIPSYLVDLFPSILDG